jgi:hypothetical protein
MKPTWPASSIVIGIVALTVDLVDSLVSAGIALAHGNGLRPAAVFYGGWGLFVVCGTVCRTRLAWRVARIVASVSAVLWACLVLLMAWGFVMSAAPFWTVGYAVFMSAVYFTIWRSFSRQSAMWYFRLVCPRCGIAARKGADLLFRRAKCKSCGEVWT